jgi:hypothetical protein
MPMMREKSELHFGTMVIDEVFFKSSNIENSKEEESADNPRNENKAK